MHDRRGINIVLIGMCKLVIFPYMFNRLKRENKYVQDERRIPPDALNSQLRSQNLPRSFYLPSASERTM